MMMIPWSLLLYSLIFVLISHFINEMSGKNSEKQCFPKPQMISSHILFFNSVVQLTVIEEERNIEFKCRISFLTQTD